MAGNGRLQINQGIVITRRQADEENVNKVKAFELYDSRYFFKFIWFLSSSSTFQSLVLSSMALWLCSIARVFACSVCMTAGFVFACMCNRTMVCMARDLE